MYSLYGKYLSGMSTDFREYQIKYHIQRIVCKRGNRSTRVFWCEEMSCGYNARNETFVAAKWRLSFHNHAQNKHSFHNIEMAASEIQMISLCNLSLSSCPRKLQSRLCSESHYLLRKIWPNARLKDWGMDKMTLDLALPVGFHWLLYHFITFKIGKREPCW